MFYFYSHSILTLEVDTTIIIVIVILQAGNWRTECARDAMASKCWTGNLC